MAGYGNRTAPDYTAEDLQDQHSTTRLGLVDSHTPYHNPHEKHGSGITGGAGFGNKRSSSTPDTDTSEFRFGSHSDTAPYSNGTAMGSGSTGGAGYGNKTGEMSGPEPDSLLGKVVEKVGGMVKNDKIEAKGRGMREKEGFGTVVE
ncbi:hypothetical protein J4E83_000568 [Alternaria metachromatica]|uniref:uncharacterized protein n=1 Tax=Alternaria metachromatica TaxID=283354 RepID=UPI0020C54A55|nr:uncharacterized protein J4E83_000568 [Alternaria metachromatica]KAI4637750.1 hypothetical protein J4E83_000568 [Alternaria metachromatica]